MDRLCIAKKRIVFSIQCLLFVRYMDSPLNCMHIDVFFSCLLTTSFAELNAVGLIAVRNILCGMAMLCMFEVTIE